MTLNIMAQHDYLILSGCKILEYLTFSPTITSASDLLLCIVSFLPIVEKG